MMIKQLSVFLENRLGRLTELTTVLGEANINLLALSIAETSEFGIIRLIVSEPERSLEVLKNNNFSVSLTDVICLSIPNRSGSLATALSFLSANNISIEYMYAFSIDRKALVIIRTDDLDDTIATLQSKDLELLKASELYSLK